jgi:hypothetical protein
MSPAGDVVADLVRLLLIDPDRLAEHLRHDIEGEHVERCRVKRNDHATSLPRDSFRNRPDGHLGVPRLSVSQSIRGTAGHRMIVPQIE